MGIGIERFEWECRAKKSGNWTGNWNAGTGMGGNGNLEPIRALHTSHTQNCEHNARDRPLAEIFTSGKPLERERERERDVG